MMVRQSDPARAVGQAMTGKERVLAALSGEETDRLCWSPLIDNYFTSSLPTQGLPAMTVSETFRMIGADILERHVPTIRAIEDSRIRRIGMAASNGFEVERVETPVGSLTSEWRHSGRGHTRYVTKYPISTIEDAKIYLHIVEHTRYAENFAAFHEHERCIGDDGVASSTGPVTPLQRFLQHLCGLENTICMLCEQPEIMKAVFEALHERNKQVYRLLAEGPSKVIIAYEDTSSTSIGPSDFSAHCAGLIDGYADICHAAGKIYITHMCGKLAAFHPQIRKGRQDGVDSVCPPTTGDTWPYDARMAWGSGKCIIGGIEPPALTWMNPVETEVYVRRVLDKMPSLRKFILSTGDATPYGTPLANLKRVTEVAAQYAMERQPEMGVTKSCSQ